MNPFQADTVVIPFDFSDMSLAAVRTGVEMTAGDGTVHVIHVMMDWFPSPTVVYGEYKEAEFKAVTLEAMEKKLQESAIETDGLELHVEIGDPGTEIAEFAKQVDAKLIVIPSHGRRGVQRVLLGSVTERVVRLAHCTVLVLKGTAVHSESL
jgi:nucleotide-binding universal stress UspA family protein